MLGQRCEQCIGFLVSNWYRYFLDIQRLVNPEGHVRAKHTTSCQFMLDEDWEMKLSESGRLELEGRIHGIRESMQSCVRTFYRLGNNVE